ncbi:MAG: AAA family ATPase [bacterium]|nr:AAA family ATPase [bacterium]
MRLKRLELHGFKSFAQKTVFDFPSGTVAIVGPNGSGKSNVIDALRWILGEREAKNLRGLKADDLIFTGGSGKSRMNMAQATIHFDNSTGFFPVAFAEVAVSRKVYRDGTSQYFLNDAEVRLKDVIDFFAGSRMGTRGLTIINQGNSDMFVKASPADRREMIEEVLGLRQFQLKRHEAELKLNGTAANLEKVSAMVEELLPRLRLLRRQSSKWAERANIEKELRELEHGYFHVKLAGLEREGLAVAPQLVAVDTEINTHAAELAALRASLGGLQQKKPNAGAQSDNRQPLFARRAELQRELGRLEAKLEYLAETKEADVASVELVAALKRVRDDLHAATTSEDMVSVRRILEDIVQRIDAMFKGKQSAPDGALLEIKKMHAAMQVELKKLDSEFAALEIAAAKDAEAFAEFNKSFQSAFEEVERKKDVLVGLQTKANQLRFDHERLTMRREELAARAREAGRTLDEFTAVPAQATLASADFTSGDALMVAERRMLKLRGELAMIGEIDEGMLKEAEETETRYTFLSTQSADLAKASEDLRGLMADLTTKIRTQFAGALHGINEQFNNYFRLMFGGGRARLVAVKKVLVPELVEGQPSEAAEQKENETDPDDIAGIDVDLTLPKGVKSLDMLSGGEKSLVSLAALFALVSVSPPPFLVLDEADAALDENNTKRFAQLIKSFSDKTQFVVVTHNRATMEAADILYGVTMGPDGASKLLSVKLES